MKKSLWAACMLLLLSVSVAHAQMKFGVKAGANLTDLKLNGDLLKVENRFGYHVGSTMLIDFPFVGWGIDASVLYDYREMRLQEGGTTSEQDVKHRQVVLPVNLRYSFGLSSVASAFLFAGPQFNYSVGKLDKTLFSSSTWNINRSTLSVNVGVGFLLLKHLQATVNYHIACGKTSEFKLTDVAKTYNARNNAWQVGLAYYF